MASLRCVNACDLERQVSTVSRKGGQNRPFKLKCLVKVLPHPGTGQAKFASVFLRLSLASAVAVVVTVGLLTTGVVTEDLIPETDFPFKVDPMSDKLLPELCC